MSDEGKADRGPQLPSPISHRASLAIAFVLGALTVAGYAPFYLYLQPVVTLAGTTGLPEADKQRHFQAGAGHYGVFSGNRWRTGIYPVVRDFIAAHDKARAKARKAA